MGSIIYYFIWLLIRNFDMKEEMYLDFKQVASLMKPFLVYIVYIYSNDFSSTTNGTMNPILALQSYIWIYILYSSQWHPSGTESVFVTSHFGRYYWVYLTAPILAACFAGSIVSIHSRITTDFKKEAIHYFSIQNK